MMSENVEKQIEKQIGCMSGFLHIFDRQQILSNKRIYSTKRLPPSSVGVDTSPESVKSVKSSPIKPVEKAGTVEPVVSVPQSPDRFKQSPASNNVTPPKSPLPFPLFETKEGTMRSSWKFCKEMPRLSLDSRATTDSKGSLCPKDNGANSRSPSVIARLMGLEQLPSSDSEIVQSPETTKKPELRRSASESRVSRDLFHSRFVEGNGLKPNKQPVEADLVNDKMRDNVRNRNAQNGRGIEARKHLTRNQKSESQWRSRSFFDSGDFFPEPKQTTMQMYGDSEKLLKMRGIDDQTNDLESLKHILEALQLKGLLHCSKRPLSYDSQRNFVYDQSFMHSDDSNSVVMKPWRSGGTNQRFGNTFGGVNDRYSSDSLPSPKKEYGGIDRSGRSPVRSKNSPPVSRNGNTIVKRKPLSIETQRSFNESTNSSRRNSPVNSPKLTTPKRNGSGTGSDYQFVTDRSPRNRRPTNMIGSHKKVARNFRTEDESSSFSESSGSTTSQSDPERPKTEEYIQGKSLLARCDKLLNSIAEMNTISESHTSSNSVLPSPVSVLDSVFDNNESSSPSPVMKRKSIDFKDVMVDMDDDLWNSIIFSSTSTNVDESEYDDSDYAYISDILRASRYFPDDSGVYYFLEKEKYGNDKSKSNKFHRKLVFDAVVEILDQKRELPPWNADSIIEYGNCNKQVYSEFLKIRDPETADNVLDLICVVLKRDLARSNGWGDHPVEVSEAVLYIERMVFKDLICETIQDLAKFAGKSTFFAPRRKLVF